MLVISVCPVLQHTAGLLYLKQAFANYKEFVETNVCMHFVKNQVIGTVAHAWLDKNHNLCLLLHVQKDKLLHVKQEDMRFAIGYSIARDHEGNDVLDNFFCSLISADACICPNQKIIVAPRVL